MSEQLRLVLPLERNTDITEAYRSYLEKTYDQTIDKRYELIEALMILTTLHTGLRPDQLMLYEETVPSNRGIGTTTRWWIGPNPEKPIPNVKPVVVRFE